MSVDVVGLGILQFGVAPAIALWDTTDANAGVLMVDLPTGGAVNVPVMAVGNGIIRTDLGFFNGLTQPEFAVLDLDKDSYISFSHSADDVGSIYTLTAAGSRTESVSFTETQTKFGGITSVVPLSDDLAALGTTALQWADLFLATGGVINWNSVDTITHSASTLTLAGIATLAGPATLTLFNTATTTLNFAGAATTIAIGAAASVTTWTGQSITLTGANSTNNTTFTVTNSSDAAAASHSIVDIRVGGTTSTGDPQLRLTVPSGTSWYVGVDNSASDKLILGTGTAVGTNPRLTFDTTAAAGTIGALSQNINRTIASGAGNIFRQWVWDSWTLSYTGATQVTTLVPFVQINAVVIDGDTATLTVDKATSLQTAAPSDSTNVSITNSSAIRILNTATLLGAQVGVYIEDLTGGATDYGIYIEGADTAAIWVNSADPIHVGLAGTATGKMEWSGATSGTVTLTVAAVAGTWTMVLPAAVGGIGEQLTDAGGNGITSWSAAASLRQYKDVIGLHSKRDALDTILGTQVYDFRYREGEGTLDHVTVYTGPMADEAPWMAHYGGRILNPVNSLGYTVLAIQALHQEYETVDQRVAQLEAENTNLRDRIAVLEVV